jgi:hypothetical protein
VSLVRYRIGTCASNYGRTLEELWAGDDKFVDTDRRPPPGGRAGPPGRRAAGASAP